VLDATADWPEAEVLAVDTDSRHLDPRQASERVGEAVRRAGAAGAQVVKKVDSMLRGNIASELHAVRAALTEGGDEVLLVVAPAFPSAGRVTRGGAVHVDEQPLDAHGSDGDVVARLRRGGLRVQPLARPRADAEALARRLDVLARGVDAVVVDAELDDDLAIVVEASKLARSRTVLVGSGGVTRPLGVSRTTPTATQRPPYDAERPTLVVIGSYEPIARAQRDRLVAAGAAPVLIADPTVTMEVLGKALASGVAVLSPDPGAPVVRADSQRVARDLATAAGAFLGDVGTLVATGGETARAVLTAAGVTRLQVVGELEPGVVRMHVPELALDVVTKAGAFGDEECLLRCVTWR
jgi:uncharacterized protein YgbK (DUF1537 family)